MIIRLVFISSLALSGTEPYRCDFKCASGMARAYFEHIDKNKKGFISEKEWVEYFLSLGTPSKGKFHDLNAQKEAETFKCLDINKDGRLREKELIYQLSRKEGHC